VGHFGGLHYGGRFGRILSLWLDGRVLIMVSKYQLYAYYRHSPKFIKQFDSFKDAEEFKADFTKQEQKVPQHVNGFEFCYIEVVQR
jgi:hypothetical protein